MQIGDRPSPGFDDPLALLSDCHRRIERFLGDLVKLSALPELDETLRSALARALDYFAEAAPRHTADEEASLFPRMRDRLDPDDPRLRHLEDDHREADALHAQVDTVGRSWLANGAIGDDERAAMRESLASLSRLYEAHIAVEDDEVFPLAADVLAPDQLQAVGYEMAQRRGLAPAPPWPP